MWSDSPAQSQPLFGEGTTLVFVASTMGGQAIATATEGGAVLEGLAECAKDNAKERLGTAAQLDNL